MKTYLKAHDLWEVVETGKEPPQLRANPTIAQMKHHSEKCAKRYKAMSYIQSVVADTIFTIIMACETVKKAQDKLKEEFQGSDKIRQMQVINLRMEFEVLKMEKEKTIR